MKKNKKISFVLMALVLFFTSCQKITPPAAEPATVKSTKATGVHLAARVAAGPTVIATPGQISDAVQVLDAPLSTYVDGGGTRLWYHSLNFGNTHQRFIGTLDAPFGTKTWEKTRAQLFTNNSSIDGQPWIISLYNHPDGVLAFLHIESAGSNGHKGRIALAWSTDNGNTFKWLGNIVIPYGDPDLANGFLIGCPYLVKDGNFYVYYNESSSAIGNVNVARASVTDVINAAKNGTVTPWTKYYNGGFSENGLYGNTSPISATGITHTNACHSTYNNKYYLTTTFMTFGGVNSYIKLWESTDAINWTLKETVAEKPASEIGLNTGYQYSSIVGTDGANNGEVGQQFYLYSGFRPYEIGFSTIFRWTIALDDSPPANSGYYRLINRAEPDKVLQLAGEPYLNYGTIVLNIVATPAGWNNYAQQWQLVDAGGGYTRLINRAEPDKVLQLAGEPYLNYGSTVLNVAGSPTGWNSFAQQWQLVDAGGYKRLINRAEPDKVLQLAGEPYLNYGSTVLHVVGSPTGWNSFAQQWQLVQVP
jgi:Ricin-type beta-trefoil lectin domain-like